MYFKAAILRLQTLFVGWIGQRMFVMPFGQVSSGSKMLFHLCWKLVKKRADIACNVPSTCDHRQSFIQKEGRNQESGVCMPQV